MPSFRHLLRSSLLVGAASAFCVSSAFASGKNVHNTPHGKGSTVKPVVHLPVVPPGWPKMLLIPRLGVKASVEDLAFASPSDITAPHRWNDVAWYDRGPRPGDLGRAVIFGHVDSYCCPAVFYGLRNLKAGDTIQVEYKVGKPLTFRVQWAAAYPNNALPTKFLWGPNLAHGLALITCAGVYHPGAVGYDHKYVVYASLVG